MFNRLLNLLYPARCPVCDDIIMPRGNQVCDSCKDILKPIAPPLCYKCGRQIISEGAEYCDTCLHYSFSFERAFSLWPYNNTVKSSLSAFKYKGRREFADYYACKLYEHFAPLINKLEVDILVPVPIHADRLLTRGFNQSALIAVKLADRLGLPASEDYLLRSKNTLAQKNLDHVARRANLRDAFSVNKNSKYYGNYIKNVLLIDDIYTTGSTANACAKALKDAGSDKVYVLCVASVRAT